MIPQAIFVQRGRLILLVMFCIFILGWVPLIARARGQAVDSGPQRYLYFVFSNPMPGEESVYNAWYDRQHIRDVVSVPGFVSAQRYVFADEQLRRVDLKKPKYLVIYTIETADLKGVSAEVMRRLKSGETKMDLSFDKESFESYVYRVFRPERVGVGGQPAGAHAGPVSTYEQVVFGEGYG